MHISKSNSKSLTRKKKRISNKQIIKIEEANPKDIFGRELLTTALN